MNAAAEQDDKKLWKQDWDDEEEEEDFGARLRQEIKIWSQITVKRVMQPDRHE